jgi:hypothetical protein
MGQSPKREVGSSKTKGFEFEETAGSELAYETARVKFREVTGRSPGSLTPELSKTWSDLISQHGEDLVVRAIELFGTEIAARIETIRYPAYLFLQDAHGWIAEASVRKKKPENDDMRMIVLPEDLEPDSPDKVYAFPLLDVSGR